MQTATKKKACTCSSYILVDFSNFNKWHQITEAASINALRKLVKVSQTVYKMLQQSAGTSPVVRSQGYAPIQLIKKNKTKQEQPTSFPSNPKTKQNKKSAVIRPQAPCW